MSGPRPWRFCSPPIHKDIGEWLFCSHTMINPVYFWIFGTYTMCRACTDIKRIVCHKHPFIFKLVEQVVKKQLVQQVSPQHHVQSCTASLLLKHVLSDQYIFSHLWLCTRDGKTVPCRKAERAVSDLLFVAALRNTIRLPWSSVPPLFHLVNLLYPSMCYSEMGASTWNSRCQKQCHTFRIYSWDSITNTLGLNGCPLLRCVLYASLQ